MTVFSHPEFDDHEHLSFFSDPETGLKAIVAIHNTARGSALGGCRMFPYADDEEALRDVLRLSRGMTYKSALANLDLGGGKSVIIGDPSPTTAYGVFAGLKAAVKHKLGREDLTGLKVAVQGVGNVGYRLARHLKEAGAELWVYDIYQENMQRAVDELGEQPSATPGP